jgi:hypothetical protein
MRDAPVLEGEEGMTESEKMKSWHAPKMTGASLLPELIQCFRYSILE